MSLVKVLVNKGTLLSEVRPLLLCAIISQTSREYGWRARCITCGSTCMVQESLRLGSGHVCRF